MAEKNKTAWDNVPKEQRRSLVFKGVLLAFAAVIVGGLIACFGIVFNPMAGVNSGEQPEELDIHEIITYEVPENAKVSGTTPGLEHPSSERISLLNESKQYIDLEVYPYEVWGENEEYTEEYLENTQKEKRSDGSVAYYNRELASITIISPDGKSVIDLSLYDGRNDGEGMTDAEYEKKMDDDLATVKSFADTIQFIE